MIDRLLKQGTPLSFIAQTIEVEEYRLRQAYRI